jgi:hypothetical protein
LLSHYIKDAKCTAARGYKPKMESKWRIYLFGCSENDLHYLLIF